MLIILIDRQTDRKAAVMWPYLHCVILDVEVTSNAAEICGGKISCSLIEPHHLCLVQFSPSVHDKISPMLLQHRVSLEIFLEIFSKNQNNNQCFREFMAILNSISKGWKNPWKIIVTVQNIENWRIQSYMYCKCIGKSFHEICYDNKFCWI